MVDKEKELKNVAPDTDVAPDVTDASSFQGEPSHPSSNRQQMRLINRIDYYKWKINLLTELISVERENLEKIEDIKGDQKEIAWGSQIRSYVFMPYTMVKDHRTNFEMGNITAVMDGDLDGFINAYLKMKSIKENEN